MAPAAVLQGKSGADALVQKITGEGKVQLRRGYSGLVTAHGKALFEHMALGLFPGSLVKIGVLRNVVKAMF